MLPIVFISCVQSRDYLGVKEGAFGIDVKKGCDEGEEAKNYYIIEN